MSVIMLGSGEQGTHFVHMVMQAPDRRGVVRVSSFVGMVTPVPGSSYHDVYLWLRGKYCPDPSLDWVVLAFDLRPNKIPE
jgi:hypothetical protein